MYGYVYKIENMLNGKIYIGQTTRKDPNNRRREHFIELNRNKHHNEHLQRAFNKYGEPNFKFTVLNWANSKDELDKLEIYFINKYDALNNIYGYNIRPGGYNSTHSLETRDKISRVLKGKYVGINNPKYKVPLSKEHRKKISDSVKGENHYNFGKKLSNETKQKISNGNKGKVRTLEHRRNYGINNARYFLGKTMPLETRKKISESNKGKKISKETISKLRKTSGKGKFGFAGANFQKDKNPERNCWRTRLSYKNKAINLSTECDPLSCEIIYNLVVSEI